MAKANPIWSNFSSGEWSQRMEGRVELEGYYRSCRVLENFIVVSQGGVDFRPGTAFVVNGKTNTNKIRLIPFSIKGVGEYILELGNEYIRYIKCSTHEQIEDAGNPVETVSPWALADLFELKYAQTKDAIYFTHPSYAPRKLTRTNDTTWVLSAPTFSGWDESTEKDITAITQAAPPQVTAVGHGLVNGDVIYITDVVGMSYLNGEIFKVTKIDDDKVTLDDIDTTTWNAYVSGGHLRKAGNIFGSANNYPAAIGFYQQRMILAGTNNYPNGVWASKAGDYLDYKMPDGMFFLIAHNRGMVLRWLTGKSELAFGADTCEGVFGGPLGLFYDWEYEMRVESGYGCKNIQAQLVNERIIYIQDGGKRIREFAYHEESAGWQSPDLTLFADHITGDGVTEVAVQRNPDTILWCVRSDGEMAGLTYEYRYGVAGWHRLVTAETSAGSGIVESIAIVRGADEDEIYVSVQRTVNGTTKRFIEYFKPRNFGTNQEDCYFVDCGITLDKGDAQNVTGCTQAHPVVITCTGHPFANDDTVKLYGLGGSTELNGQVWTVQNKAANTFELKETDAFAAWDAAATYYTGAICEDGGNNYVALEENINKQPSVETDYWDLWPTAYTSGGYAREVVISVDGLDHLEGESVAILADGATHPDKTVSGGIITLDRYASVIHAGLGYSAQLKPQRIEAGASYGTSQGKKKRIHKLIFRVYKSLCGKIGPDEDNLQAIIPESETMDTYTPLYSGDIGEDEVFPGEFSRSDDILIVQDKPLPFNILAIMPELITND